MKTNPFQTVPQISGSQFKNEKILSISCLKLFPFMFVSFAGPFINPFISMRFMLNPLCCQILVILVTMPIFLKRVPH